jgi:hypothetical protein
MSGFPVSGENRLARLLRKYRRAIGIFAAVFSVYALAGFFLVPWLVKKNAVEIVADTIGAELRIENVAVIGRPGSARASNIRKFSAELAVSLGMDIR